MVEAEAAEERVRLHTVARDAQWLLHAEPGDRVELAPAIGIELPDDMLRSATTGDWSALHLSPDEWLLVGVDPAASPRLIELHSIPHSLVDVSHRSMAIDIDGAGATTLIAGACGLDLDTIPSGACTRTLFGKTTVLLWRRGESWRISYPRSFDGYVRTLIDAILPDLG